MPDLAELYLPDRYGELMTPNDYGVHEGLAATSLAEFVEEMALADVHSIELANGHQIRAVDLRAREEADSGNAIVLPLPFGNGYSPAMHIRATAVQDFLSEGKRVLIFPNNTASETWYTLPEDRSVVTSLAEGITEATEKIGVNKIDIVGYSQAATVGGQILSFAADNLDVGGVLLGDAPNVIDRTEKQLKKDFKGKGLQALKALNDAINDSDIPALDEAQHATRGLRSSIAQLRMFARFAKGGKLPINHRLHQAMTRDTFVDRLRLAATRGKLPTPQHMVVARMATSLVCPPELEADMSRMGLGDYLEVVEGYGHEGGDNVVLHALLARLAIEGKPTDWNDNPPDEL